MLSVAAQPSMDIPSTLPAPVNEDVACLRAMFPDVENDTLLQLLAYHEHSVDRVVDMLLDTSAQDEDVAVARQVQADQDEAMAMAVHESLQQELKAEEARQKQNELPAVAARAVTSASAKAQSFLQRVTSAHSSRKPPSTSTHTVRLLDAPPESGDEPAYDMRPMSPLQATMAYAPPAQPTPPPVTTVDVSDENVASVFPTTTTPAPTASAEARYSSRMDRARTANRQRSQSALKTEPQPPITTLAPLQTPAAGGPIVGELI